MEKFVVRQEKKQSLDLGYADVLTFWFKEIERKFHFIKDVDFDRQITERYLPLHEKACKGELYGWRDQNLGSLAEIILLDQFSRNMFRDQSLAFAFDNLALVLAQNAIQRGFDRELEPEKRKFMYMPFMHSESREIHEIAMTLFSQPGLTENLRFERRHKEIIDKFGRYPHRNAVLGRTSTAEEIEFLQQPASSF